MVWDVCQFSLYEETQKNGVIPRTPEDHPISIYTPQM
jgi:hypothetical protein